MITSAYNPGTSQLEKTYLSQYVAENSASLAVKNTDRFAITKRIMIGRGGDERTEILTTGTVTAPNTIAVTTNTQFAHNGDDPVYLLQYDKIKFYRSATKTGTYSLVTTVDIDVDNTDGVTKYDDATGSATDYYKVTYYNSISTDESEFSSPTRAQGYDSKSIGKVINEHISQVSDTGFTILSMDDYLNLAQEVNDDMQTQTLKPYGFLKKVIALNTVAAQGYIDLTTEVTDFWKFNYLVYTWGSGSQARKYKIDEPISAEAFLRKYSDVNYLDSDELMDVAIDEENDRILLGPAPKTSRTGVVELYYYKTFDNISDPGDIVETPNTLVYKYKFRAEYYAAKAEGDKQMIGLADRYDAKYGNEVVKMQRTNRVDVGTPRSFAPRKVPGMRKRYTL